MLLLKFNPDELKGCRNVQQIYNVFGIGTRGEGERLYDVYWDDQSVFGKRGDVRNIFCTQGIYDLASQNFKRNQLVGREENGSAFSTRQMSRKDGVASFEWAMFSPTSCGPRYELMERKLRELTAFEKLPDSMIVIFTPEDKEYKESPAVGD